MLRRLWCVISQFRDKVFNALFCQKPFIQHRARVASLPVIYELFSRFSNHYSQFDKQHKPATPDIINQVLDCNARMKQQRQNKVAREKATVVATADKHRTELEEAREAVKKTKTKVSFGFRPSFMFL